MYTNDPAKGNRITHIQQDSIGFAQSLSAAVEQNYQWSTGRGLQIVATAIIAIEYDENDPRAAHDVQRADALLGARGNSNLQASVAQGLHAAGESGGAAGVLGVAMASGISGAAALQQPVVTPDATNGSASSVPSSGPGLEEAAVARLTHLKELFDAGLITQTDYDAARAKVLGL